MTAARTGPGPADDGGPARTAREPPAAPPGGLAALPHRLVAHHHDSPFELYAHTRAGAAAGLSPEDLAALAAGQPPARMTEVERACYTAARRVLASGTADDEQYAQAVSVLGTRQLFELITLIGWYSMVAIQLAVFGLAPPGD